MELHDLFLEGKKNYSKNHIDIKQNDSKSNYEFIGLVLRFIGLKSA